MKLLILSTSPRNNSQTLRFSGYLRKQFEIHSEIESAVIVDFLDFDIPSIGRGTIDSNNLSAYQKKLISSWSEADIIIFSLPEYNWTTNGEVFTLLDQLGGKNFSHLFDNKVFGMVGVSSGRGGRLPALEVGKVVNKLISFLNKLSIVSPKIFEAHEVGKNVDEFQNSTGNLIFEAGVNEFVKYTLSVSNRWLSVNSLA